MLEVCEESVKAEEESEDEIKQEDEIKSEAGSSDAGLEEAVRYVKRERDNSPRFNSMTGLSFYREGNKSLGSSSRPRVKREREESSISNSSDSSDSSDSSELNNRPAPSAKRTKYSHQYQPSRKVPARAQPVPRNARPAVTRAPSEDLPTDPSEDEHRDALDSMWRKEATSKIMKVYRSDRIMILFPMHQPLDITWGYYDCDGPDGQGNGAKRRGNYRRASRAHVVSVLDKLSNSTKVYD